MDRNDSHGRHGGNRGSGETRDDPNPNQAPNTDVDSQAKSRSEDKGGGKRLGG